MMKASVTVAFCLALPVLAVFLLSLLEAARYPGLQSDASDYGNLAAESLFAGYQPFLLKEYGIFFLDGAFGGGRLDLEEAGARAEAMLYENLPAPGVKQGISLYRMDVAQASVTSVRLATDENGKVFQMQAAKTMKRLLGQKAAKQILERIKGAKEKCEEAGNPGQYMEEADRALEEIRQRQETERQEAAKASSPGANLPQEAPAAGAAQEEGGAGGVPANNPMDAVLEMKRSGILSLVLPAEKAVSGKSVCASDSLLKRKLEKGTYAQEQKPGWYERVLMQEYVKDCGGNAISPKEGGALSYGTEYLICGKDSDEKNLEHAVKQIMLLREAANFLYLQTDEAKKAQALAAATALAGASANPAVVAVVKQGILAAWAYAESVCDARALLSGGKAPLMKRAASWQTSLSNLGGAVTKQGGGSSEGMSYEHYLDLLLYTKSVKTLAYRCMDLMEWQMRGEKQYRACRMDHMIAGARILTEYRADSLFLGLFGSDPFDGYRFTERAEYVYES